MAFESFKQFLGLDEKEGEAPAYNKEAEEQTVHAQVLTGREDAMVHDDLSQRQEAGPTSSFERISPVVETIMTEFGISKNDLLGREDFFLAELKKRGAITESDERFNPHGLVRETLEAISGKKAA